MATGTNGQTQRQYARPDWTDFAHIGPGTLAGRYMRMFWHPVLRIEDLQPGRAMPMRLLGEDFTLYRGEGGKPHALAFRCAHRGTQLSTGWVERDDLRCFYHGWKYEPSGQCIEQPAELEPFCQKIQVPGYPAEEYLGLIFVYIGEGDVPPLPRYRDFEEAPAIEVIGYPTAPCNYFNRLENAPDDVHLLFVHKSLGLKGLPKMEWRETDYGMQMQTTFPGGWHNRAHFLMPAITQFSGNRRLPEETRPREVLVWRHAIDDGHYRSFQVAAIFLPPEAVPRLEEQKAKRREVSPPTKEMGDAVLAGKLPIDEVPSDRPDLFEIQDYVSQVGQGMIADRPNEHLGRTDTGVIMLRKIWERELSRLAHGRPLKQWRRPERLSAVLRREREPNAF